MSVKIKSKKHLKREHVVPFDGEENFVVPVKGGFGMSDNEDYISVARADIGDGSYKNLGEISASTPTPAYQDTANMSCDALKQYQTILQGYLSQINSYDASVQQTINAEYQNVSYKIQNSCNTPVPSPDVPVPPPDLPPPPPTPDTPVPPPTFPAWSTLSCAELTANIDVLDRKMASGLFSPDAATLYNNELAKAKSEYINKKCDIPTPPTPAAPTPPITTVTSTTTFTPTFGGGGFGSAPSGGGGGGEAAPQPVKKDSSWLWLLLIVGGIYLATKKKKG